jgi:hypothetical protein
LKRHGGFKRYLFFTEDKFKFTRQPQKKIFPFFFFSFLWLKNKTSHIRILMRLFGTCSPYFVLFTTTSLLLLFLPTPVMSSSNAFATKAGSPGSSARLSAELSEIVNKELKDDIEMLSNMLAQVVKSENPRVYDLYMQLRKHGLDRAADPNNTEAFQLMKKLSFDISPQDALGVMRVFSIALNLINSAEVHHKLRTMRQDEMTFSKMNNDTLDESRIGPLPMVEDSARGTFDLVLRDGASKEDIYNKLIHQKVEIVITAHPTEGE